MAYAMTKCGSLDNIVTYEFICDTITDMNAIDNKYKTIGTIAIVLSGESDTLEVYICGSDKQWSNLGAIGAGESASSSGGLSIYMCTQNEVSQGLPDIEDPDETTLYLVPASEESGNLYDEYIYVNNAWEKFGGARINLSGYVTVNNPTMTGAISLNRRPDTTIGTNSVAIGTSNVASGNYSHAEGSGTEATGENSHTEGSGSKATGPSAHAEGSGSKATGFSSHAEGGGTQATGSQSHAEGGGTRATGGYAHAEGGGTNSSGMDSHAEGGGTKASATNAHAEGAGTQATGVNSHAEGASTIASGVNSHAEGVGTVSIGYNEHAAGQYNILDSAPAWTSGTSYSVGDLVSKEETYIDGGGTSITRTVIYKCNTGNTDIEFTSSKWIDSGQYLIVVGNGTGNNNRSNAYALDLDGNERIKGDLYVGCNSDSTGGNKVATESFVTTRVPAPPVSNGTYTLQVTINNGEATYAWV